MQPSLPISASRRWSLLLFALTAAGTIAARHCPQEGLALALDLIPFVGASALAVIVAARLYRSRVDPMTNGCVSYSLAASSLVGALGTAHLSSVIAEAAQAPFMYDFRSYSLMLLGLLLMAPGYRGVVSASTLIDTYAPSKRHLTMVWFALLIVNVPLIPLQGFAMLFTALGCIGLLALWFMPAPHQGSPSGS